MVIRKVDMIRLEVLGLDDEAVSAEVVSTCLRCGTRLTCTRCERWPEIGEEAIRRIARADGKVAAHHRC